MRSLRRTLTASLTVALAAQTLAQTPPAPLVDEKVRQMAAAQVAAGAFPSLVIGVVHGDRRQVVSFGSVADGQRKEADGDTVYEIGSVTKTFTALLLADAVERGEVTLDDPVQKLLPGWSIPRSGERAITLLDLATQSSGLPRLPENLLPKDPSNPYADYRVDDLKAFLASYRLPRAPGERVEYSNLGFGLLGQALATRAGTSYGELVARRIATPLALKDTAVTPTPRMAERFAPGHDPSGKPASRWDLGALQGAGALRSTANDLLTYVGAHLSPAGPLAKALARVARPQRASDGPDRRIGLAWQVEKRGARDVLWHNGMTGGYASFVAFTADGERGVVVLTNVARDVGVMGFAALLPETVTDRPKELVLAKDALSEYAGRYRLAPTFELTVTATDDGLSVQATGQPAVPVYASAKDEFFYKVVEARLSFHRDAGGRIDSVTLHQNGRDMPAPRVAGAEARGAEAPAAPAPTPRKEVALDAAALQAYVGRYALAPGFLLDVTADGAQLHVQATGQGRLPAFASAKDEFFLKVVDAQLSFVRGKDGAVEAVVLHQNGHDTRGQKQVP